MKDSRGRNCSIFRELSLSGFDQGGIGGFLRTRIGRTRERRKDVRRAVLEEMGRVGSRRRRQDFREDLLKDNNYDSNREGFGWKYAVRMCGDGLKRKLNETCSVSAGFSRGLLATSNQ